MLDDFTETNGATRYVPRTHKAGRLPQIKAQVGGTYMDGLEGIKTSKLLENVVGVGDLQPDKLITRGTVSVEQVLSPADAKKINKLLGR